MSTQPVHTGESPPKADDGRATAISHDEWPQTQSASRTEVGFPDASSSAAFATTTAGIDLSNVINERIRLEVPLVSILVCERLRTTPSHVTRDDLMSAGMTALVLSAKAFDPALGVPFAVFASFRIRGALLDELRSMDWTTRAVRARARDLEVIKARLTATLARQPRREEIAAAMGITTTEVDRVNSDVANGSVLSLQSFVVESLPVHSDTRAIGPESLILQRERMGYLHDAVAALPDRLRFVIVAYFFQQRQMTDIAGELSVTPSRVSQMCAEALVQLRDGINSQLDPDDLPSLASKGRAAASRRAYYRAIAEGNSFAGRLAMSDAHGEMHVDITAGYTGDSERLAG